MNQAPGAQRRVSMWAIYLIVGAGVYVTAADFGLTNIAVPTIANHFDADLPSIQWVVIVHVLASAAFLLPAGAVGDALGRKRLFVGGFVFFAVGALLCAASGSLPQLLVARGLQGVGSGVITGVGWASLVNAAPPEQRGRTLGFLTGTVAVGMVSGPVFGGLLVDAFGWRSVFLFTAAIAVVGTVFVQLRLQKDTPDAAPSVRRLDWLGMVFAAGAIVGAILMLTSGPRTGWGSAMVIVPGTAAGCAFAALVLVELRHPSPMIDLRLFRNRAFSMGSMGMFLTFITLAITPVMLPFYLQGVLDYSPRATGLILAPQMMMLGLFGLVGGRIADRIGSRWPAAAGASLMLASYLIFTRLDPETSLVLLIIPLMLQGMGNGLLGPANNSGIVSSVGAARMGVATSFANLARATGLNVGIAIATIVVTLGITSMGVEPDIGVFREEGAVPAPRLVDGFVAGLGNAYLVAAGIIAAAGLAIVTGMPDRRSGQGAAAQQAAPATAAAVPHRPDGTDTRR